MPKLTNYYSNLSIAELNLMYVESLQFANDTERIAFEVNDGRITQMIIEGGHIND